MRIRDALDTAANLCIILTCVLFAAVITSMYAKAPNRTTGPRTANQVPTYAIGDVVGGIAGLTFDAERSLLVVFRSACQLCTDSMPFYRRVADGVSRTAGTQRIQFVGVTIDPLAVGSSYLTTHRLHLSKVVATTRASLRAGGTPTLLLVDRSGRIKRIWIGRLSADQEREVLDDFLGARELAD
jgi:hypothetical protein